MQPWEPPSLVRSSTAKALEGQYTNEDPREECKGGDKYLYNKLDNWQDDTDARRIPNTSVVLMTSMGGGYCFGER